MVEGGLNYLTQKMKKEKIINFDGVQFSDNRRTRSPHNRRWQIRRQVKNKLGVSRNLRSVFANLLGLY